MKKYFVAAIAGAVAGMGIYKATKIKRKKAREARRHVPYGPYEAYFKRPFDYMAALLALVFLSPILGIVALMVRARLGSPVIFTQERPGKDGKTFKLYKFRTMTDERDESGELLPDETRLTEFGKKLRGTSLDELPELFNILKGNMSFIGPRPLLTVYLPYYTEEEFHRHDVRPGLTGLSQVHGRNYMSWNERFGYDLVYVNNISLLRDIKILIDTIKVVLKHSGVADRSQIQVDENGETVILIDGVKHKYPKPLDVERKKD